MFYIVSFPHLMQDLIIYAGKVILFVFTLLKTAYNAHETEQNFPDLSQIVPQMNFSLISYKFLISIKILKIAPHAYLSRYFCVIYSYI